MTRYLTCSSDLEAIASIVFVLMIVATVDYLMVIV